uniref:Uncharacterized protein n=1 Tax=Tetraselmis sp. GSL018 TaxID=582737 RepID=A0A061RK88_9CHLO|mmetsp:Transcript_12995/g.30827  ORF Transcript_12995/g.30827 Transcript_12995/m.30827 type:complete len:203 (+) Transcript_12995:158-766(+)
MTSDTEVGFEAIKRRVLLDAQQQMIKCIRGEFYEDALKHAEKAVAIAPEDAMTRQFLTLLQEKAELDGSDSESEDGEEEAREGLDADSDGSSEASSETSRSESSTDATEQIGEGTAGVEDGYGNGAGAYETESAENDTEEEDTDDEPEEEFPDVISAGDPGLKMTPEQRKQMRESLSLQVQKLRLEQERQRRTTPAVGDRPG